ncbi:MAG: response regulator transcription factor [Candidatus Absconditicoccaceae bacterium]
MNILLVEDHKVIANNIKKYLELEGNNVLVVENGLYALEVVKHQIFDIILLDIMLPGLDGISICKKIRESQNNTPIIMTTSKGELEDKLEGFDYGADDYMVKPFELKELSARINAISKRVATKDVIDYKYIRLDKDQKKVFKKNKEIKFTIKEFMILQLLLENIGRGISRTTIVEEIWGSESIFDEDSKLDVYISNIRKKLGKTLIETIKGFGYKIG